MIFTCWYLEMASMIYAILSASPSPLTIKEAVRQVGGVDRESSRAEGRVNYKQKEFIIRFLTALVY